MGAKRRPVDAVGRRTSDNRMYVEMYVSCRSALVCASVLARHVPLPVPCPLSAVWRRGPGDPASCSRSAVRRRGRGGEATVNYIK